VPGGGGYTDPDMDSDPEPVAHPQSEPERKRGPGYAGPIPDGHYPGDTWRVSVFDAGGRLVLNGHATQSLIDAISNLADGLTIRYGEPDDGVGKLGRGRVLPLRPQPQPYPNTNAITYREPHGATTYVGDPPIFAVAFTHTHRHPHTEPDDPLRAAYWHGHPHTHHLDPYGRPDPHAYEHGGDAALHDHPHG
jgi:hypothetical protein